MSTVVLPSYLTRSAGACAAWDAGAMETLAAYIIRASFFQTRMDYLPKPDKVIYRAKSGRDQRSYIALEWPLGLSSGRRPSGLGVLNEFLAVFQVYVHLYPNHSLFYNPVGFCLSPHGESDHFCGSAVSLLTHNTKCAAPISKKMAATFL